MNKTTRVLLLIGVIIVLSYPGIAWVTGMAVESHLQHNEQQVLARAPYVTVVKREYHRGVYRSTATTTFSVRIPAGAAAALLSAFTLTVSSNIQHGPLLGLHGVGLAQIDSTIVAPPALQKELSAVIGARPLAQLHSTVGLLGGTTGELTSPAFSLPLPNGAKLVWGGITVNGSASRNQAAWSGKLSAPRLFVQGPRGGRFELTGMEYSGSHQKAFGDLYLGSGTFTIERLDGSGPRPGSDFSLQRIAVTTRSKADGDFFDMRVDIAMDAAKIAALQLTNLMYSQAFEHVHGPSFASMVRAVRAAQLQSGGNQAQLQAGIRNAFRQYGVALLAHDPVIDIRQLSFTMPEGSLLLSAKISAPGLAAADLQMPAAIMALRTRGRVTADLRVDNGLVQKLLAMGGSNPKVAAQLTSFEQQGYLTAGPASVTTHVEFSSGRMTLNGHPFPPAPPVN
ncbi:MAG TPA: YdgA family protein [Steroidobacteraceae bacterium]